MISLQKAMPFTTIRGGNGKHGKLVLPFKQRLLYNFGVAPMRIDMKPDIKELEEMLMTAANMLSNVYHYACENGMPDLESQMSCADTCIHEAMDYLEKLK